ncbi:MAG TPA: hypothetical protein VH141_35005 [Pseudonocardia sp.]|nr:hypothetical protein [Pseudonocardia sp.]
MLNLVVRQARDTLLAAMHTAPEELGPLIRHGVRAFTDFALADRGRGRVMFAESRATPALATRGAELIAEFTGPIAAARRGRDLPAPTLEKPAPTLENPAPDNTTPDDTTPDDSDVELNALAIFGALAFLYPRWLRPSGAETPQVPEERFVEHVAQVIEQLAGARSTPRR